MSSPSTDTTNDDSTSTEPTFRSNDESTPEMLQYLLAEIRLKEAELNELVTKERICREELATYTKTIEEEEAVSLITQQILDAHSANLDLIRRSRRSALLADLTSKKVETGTYRSPLKQVVDSLITQVSSTEEQFDALVRSEESKLRKASAVLQETRSGTELVRLRIMVNNQQQEQLRTSIKLLESNIWQMRKAMRPQMRIPDEIWSRVFLIAMEDDFDDYTESHTPEFYMPVALSLSQVCCRWRRITHANTMLWAYMGFRLQKLWEAFEKEAFLYFLAKARGCHVHLVVDMSTARKERSPNQSLNEKVDITSLPELGEKLEHSLHIREPPETFKFQALYSETGLSTPTRVTFYGAGDTRSILTLDAVPKGSQIWFKGTLPSLDVASMLGQSNYLSLQTYNPGETYDVSPFLLTNLTCLYLIGDDLDISPPRADFLVLPNLLELEISAMQQGIMKTLHAPNLDRLHIDPPDRGNETNIDDWCTGLLKLSVTCSTLIFEWWSRPNVGGYTTPHRSAVTVCLKLVKGSPRLKKLNFFDSYIEGEKLSSELGTCLGYSQTSAKAIDMIAIDRCTGITWMDCDKLSKIVGRLDVYI
ncbi:hypothetical protein FRC17_003921 [Serendipita sp. 399]|nr:hypothetical protein FRC17_003921 [Serendipita sp. 399]